MIIWEDNVKNAAIGIKKILEEKSASKDGFKSLLEDSDDEMVKLQISCYKLPKMKKTQNMSIKIPLPHSLVDDATNVFLITKDLEKGLHVDHEQTHTHYQDLLSKHDCLHHVSQIMPLRQLKVEYKEYEAKRNLSELADVMLCDDKVIRFVPLFLGKFFYKKKKNPVQINLSATNLKEEFSKVLSQTHLHMSMKGNCTSVNVGLMTHTPDQINENVQAVILKLKQRFPGGWENIKCIHMKSKASLAVPIYLNLTPKTGVVKHPVQNKNEEVSGVLSTLEDEVLVKPTGEVIFKNKISDEVKEDFRLTIKEIYEGKKVPKFKKFKNAESKDEVEEEEEVDLVMNEDEDTLAELTEEIKKDKKSKKKQIAEDAKDLKKKQIAEDAKDLKSSKKITVKSNKNEVNGLKLKDSKKIRKVKTNTEKKHPKK